MISPAVISAKIADGREFIELLVVGVDVRRLKFFGAKESVCRGATPEISRHIVPGKIS
jgi:hypothetical protein